MIKGKILKVLGTYSNIEHRILILSIQMAAIKLSFKHGDWAEKMENTVAIVIIQLIIHLAV